MSFILPEDVRHILRTLQADGHDAYAVGGCVRDRLMGVAPKDWDIATSAQPLCVKQLFARTFDTGLQHGTVTVLINHRPYEVTTFRVDGVYLDNRRPSAVTFTTDISADLSRRDFTMNAIAYNPDAGFVDPFEGRKDIARKVIRCVGQPSHRFGEDALRMLRAVRFAAQLGFTVDRDTLEAILPLKHQLTQISAERIREELTKLLLAPYPQAAMLLETTGLLSFVLRGRVYEGDLYETAKRIGHCPPAKDPAMVFALFLAWAGPESEDILRDLRFDNKTIREAGWYIEWLPVAIPCDRYEIKKILNQLPPYYFDKLLTLQSVCADSETESTRLTAIRALANDIVACGECFSLPQLAVNGDDLALLGLPRGKEIGDTLHRLLDAVMREPALNNKSTLLKQSIVTTSLTY